MVLLILNQVGVVSLSGGRHSASGATPIPAEFMYLDSARVNTYLSQIDNGDIEKENRQETTTKNANVGLELSTVGKANASTGSQLVRNIVITKTAADRFQKLKNEWKPKPLDANACNFVTDLSPTKTDDGTIVKIEHALVEMPSYLSAYPELRYAKFRQLPTSNVFGEVPLGNFRQVDESVRGTPKKERNKFKKLVGPNPRIPLSFAIWSTTRRSRSCNSGTSSGQPEPEAKGEHRKQVPEVTVVLPARFANLTGDPSLLAVPLTVVGIVVSNHRGGFGDGTSLAAYWPALSVAKAPLLRELGVQAGILKKKRIDVRKELFNAVKQSVTFPGHVVEVVPIAMYN